MKLKIIALAAIAAIAFSAFAEEEPTGYALYETGVALMEQAQAAFDRGDYDSAADLAAQAAYYFKLYDEYANGEASKKARAGDKLSKVESRLERAKSLGEDERFPEMFAEAAAGYDQAKSAYDSADYANAEEKADAALATLDSLERASDARTRLEAGREWLEELRKRGLAEASPETDSEAVGALESGEAAMAAFAWDEAAYAADKADEALGKGERILAAKEAIEQADARYAEAEKRRLPERVPNLAYVAKGRLDAAKEAYETADYDSAENLARESVATLEEMDAALSCVDVLDEAIARVKWAADSGGATRFPAELEAASFALNEANALFGKGDYALCEAKAREAIDALAGVKGLEPLPRYYVVRLVPGNRDCFWNIAALPFIYNDATLWWVLIEANRNILTVPGNPDLILPGQVVFIPSVSGETREGTYDPDKQYETFQP
jgi:hypothetical protein